MGRNGDTWRWNVMKHPRPTAVTIVVPEPAPDAIEERAKKIREGADVVPFGFGRAVQARALDEPPDVQAPGLDEPLLWDGDNG